MNELSRLRGSERYGACADVARRLKLSFNGGLA